MRIRRILLSLVVVLIALYLLRFQWLPPIAGWLNVSEPRLPVDYVIPLPGGNDTRPFAAAALVRAKLAKRVAIVVNQMTPNVRDQIVLPMHQVSKQVLILRGVPQDDVLMLSGTSDSTFSDIQIIGGLFRQEPSATIAIVTSAAHTRRVRWTVNQLLPQFRQQVCLIATYNDLYDERIWWQDQGGLHEILSEYLKLVFYVLRYSSPGQRTIAGVMISLVTIALIKLACRKRAQRRSPSDTHAAESAQVERADIHV